MSIFHSTLLFDASRQNTESSNVGASNPTSIGAVEGSSPCIYPYNVSENMGYWHGSDFILTTYHSLQTSTSKHLLLYVMLSLLHALAARLPVRKSALRRT